MASVFSQPKNSTNSAAADIARLLQSKAGLEPVTAGLIGLAERLRGLGLITYRQSEYVCCAFTEDDDFPYSNRTCTGRLHIKPSLDENANDYRCPECRRVVYPARHRKRQFQELCAQVLPNGVRSYVEKALAKSDGAARAVGGEPYVWRIEGGLTGIHVCLADFCENQQVLSVQWAQQYPTCYVAVNPRAIERFVPIDWVPRVMLADLVAGTVSLVDKVREIGADTTPHDLPPLATPAYSKGAHRPAVVTPEEEIPRGLFVMELGERIARINGMDVLDTRAKTGHAVLRELV